MFRRRECKKGELWTPIIGSLLTFFFLVTIQICESCCIPLGCKVVVRLLSTWAGKTEDRFQLVYIII